MAFRSNIAGSFHRALVARSGARHAAVIRATLMCACAAGPLAGCGGSVGSLMVDPARYDGMHCNDLVNAWATLISREKELRLLIDKASEGGGGSVVAAVAYRSDYETVLAQQKTLKQRAAVLNCQLVPTYSSDQTIR